MKPPIHPRHLLIVSSLSLLAWPAQAVIVGPYTTDANTLQLWHLDESSGTTGALTNVAAGGISTLSPVNINETTVSANNTLMGGAGFSGFGNALDLTSAGDTAGLVTTTGTNKQGVSTSAVTGAGGVFTFEALVRPTAITGEGNMQIIAMDSDNADRVFQFRITDTGNLEFIELNGNITAAAASIPTAGPDAFVANNWYHAAVTYNGIANTADNIEFFWTRMDNSRTVVNSIGTGTIDSDLPNLSVAFSVGNDSRGPGTEMMEGLIDEVRVSNIVRGPEDMMFTIPEPSTYGLLIALATACLLVGRHRV